ncbi:MAG TPA: transglycosylase SLT domain-containing protein [Methylomirabilota bacterium]|nr:transglycosylase SLT domain-containing protein [Methylomirabilota bacterium]
MTTRARQPLIAAVVTLTVFVLIAPAGAQVLRVEDEAGVVHFTNSPCDPRYLRLAPGACSPPVVAPTAPPPAPGFAREIESAATRYGVDRRLVEAVVQVESAGNHRAVSPKGAGGLMQLMPGRAATLGIADVFDPAANLDGGVRHLRNLLARYDGNLRLVLAAYNAGEDAVRAHGGVPPYRETREYVRKVLSIYQPVVPAVWSGAPAKLKSRL